MFLTNLTEFTRNYQVWNVICYFITQKDDHYDFHLYDQIRVEVDLSWILKLNYPSLLKSINTVLNLNELKINIVG